MHLHNLFFSFLFLKRMNRMALSSTAWRTDLSLLPVHEVRLCWNGTHTCGIACYHMWSGANVLGRTRTPPHIHTYTSRRQFSQQRNQWVDSPRGRCARGMIPPLRILIGFRWLRWSAGHLPNHPTLMTWLDMLIDSIEGASKDTLQPSLLCSLCAQPLAPSRCQVVCL